ncbi:unnamed protein product [Amoebophrya sp. A120]|nr:unnamed protein product [Amoebophrya sp. A120]|eukprot:GSA120T00007656001.1
MASQSSWEPLLLSDTPPPQEPRCPEDHVNQGDGGPVDLFSVSAKLANLQLVEEAERRVERAEQGAQERLERFKEEQLLGGRRLASNCSSDRGPLKTVTVSVGGYGSTRPMYAHDPYVGMSANERLDIMTRKIAHAVGSRPAREYSWETNSENSQGMFAPSESERSSIHREPPRQIASHRKQPREMVWEEGSDHTYRSGQSSQIEDHTRDPFSGPLTSQVPVGGFRTKYQALGSVSDVDAALATQGDLERQRSEDLAGRNRLGDPLQPLQPPLPTLEEIIQEEATKTQSIPLEDYSVERVYFNHDLGNRLLQQEELRQSQLAQQQQEGGDPQVGQQD